MPKLELMGLPPSWLEVLSTEFPIELAWESGCVIGLQLDETLEEFHME